MKSKQALPLSCTPTTNVLSLVCYGLCSPSYTSFHVTHSGATTFKVYFPFSIYVGVLILKE